MTSTPQIGKALDVSERTVFRHIKKLRAEGHNIVGEAGAGIELRRPPTQQQR